MRPHLSGIFSLVMACCLAGTARAQYRIDRFTTSDGLPQNTVSGIAQTPDGYLWFSTFDGLARYDGMTFTVFDRGNTPIMRQTQFITLTVDRAGTLWAGTGTGMLRYRNGAFEWLDPPATEDGRIHPALPAAYAGYVPDSTPPFDPGPGFEGYQQGGTDRSGHRWMFRDNELVRFSGTLVMRMPAMRTFGSSFVRVMFCDREGTIWVGTNELGLFRVDRAFLASHSVEQGLLQRIIYPILEDRTGAVWIAGGRVLTRLRGREIRSFAALPVRGGYRLVPITRQEQAEGALGIGALHEDRAGRLWIGGGGVLVSVENERITSVMETGTGNVGVILEDRAGDLWLGTQEGLLRKRGAELTRFGPADGIGTGVNVLLEDRGGRLWAGSRRGLLHRDGERFVADSGLGLEDDLVRSLHEDKDGALWIGTFDHGLLRLAGGRLARITSREGLFTNGVFRILADDRDQFWISCNRGIYRVSRRQLVDFAEGRVPGVSAVSYGTRDGMRSLEANGGREPAGMRARDGSLWFPTQDGVVVIDPDAIAYNAQAPVVVFERAAVDGAAVDPRGEVRLRPGQADLRIAYTAPSSVQAEHVQFRYRLRGLGDAWTDAGTRREVQYSHLPPGHYTLEVVAANSDGVWNNAGTALDVRVEPFFWQTGWFRLAALALVFGLSLGSYRLRLRGLRAQERHLTSVVETRTAELRDANERLNQLASEDGLTGLANHRHFEAFLHGAWQRARRTPAPLSLLMLDVDHFKAYNDALGHPAGDACLRNVADVLGGAVRRGTDLAARYGGEEFAVVLTDTGADGARRMAETIRGLVEGSAEPHPSSPVAPVVTVSIGVATLAPGDTTTPEELVAAADRALYAAKSSGRNRVM